MTILKIQSYLVLFVLVIIGIGRAALPALPHMTQRTVVSQRSDWWRLKIARTYVSWHCGKLLLWIGLKNDIFYVKFKSTETILNLPIVSFVWAAF